MKAYWETIGSKGTSIAPPEKRQVTAEQIAEAEALLAAAAERIRKEVSA